MRKILNLYQFGRKTVLANLDRDRTTIVYSAIKQEVQLANPRLKQVFEYRFNCFEISLKKGITIVNELEVARCEHFLRRIISKLKIQSTEIFTEDERQKLVKVFEISCDDLLLSVKTIIYIFKRLNKFIFMPMDLKNDLRHIGFNNEKADLVVKVWSSDTRSTLHELSRNTINESNDLLNFSWKLNAELSSDTCKKSKVPKSYITLAGDKESSVVELTHSELYSMFMQFESIQNELDNLI